MLLEDRIERIKLADRCSFDFDLKPVLENKYRIPISEGIEHHSRLAFMKLLRCQICLRLPVQPSSGRPSGYRQQSASHHFITLLLLSPLLSSLHVFQASDSATLSECFHHDFSIKLRLHLCLTRHVPSDFVLLALTQSRHSPLQISNPFVMASRRSWNPPPMMSSPTQVGHCS